MRPYPLSSTPAFPLFSLPLYCPPCTVFNSRTVFNHIICVFSDKIIWIWTTLVTYLSFSLFSSGTHHAKEWQGQGRRTKGQCKYTPDSSLLQHSHTFPYTFCDFTCLCKGLIITKTKQNLPRLIFYIQHLEFSVVSPIPRRSHQHKTVWACVSSEVCPSCL